MEVGTGDYRNVPCTHPREPETASSRFGTPFDDVGYSSAWNLVRLNNHVKEVEHTPIRAIMVSIQPRLTKDASAVSYT